MYFYFLRLYNTTLCLSPSGQTTLTEIAEKILRVLAVEAGGMSVKEIAETINGSEYDVEEVLDSWFEFLQLQQIDKETKYSLYHPNFLDWLKANFNLRDVN